MSPETIGYLCVGLLCVLLMAGVPVAVTMALVGALGMWWGIGLAFLAGQFTTLPYAVASNYAYAVLPLFVLMGLLAEKAGITDELFRAADLWLRHLRGGLYQAVIVGSAIFSAISGSTIVNAVVFTRIAYPQMIKAGYDRSLSVGCIAACGALDAMIPPSITMVIYAIITEQSVGQLLVAGIIPGILTAIVYMGGVALMVRLKPSLAPGAVPRVPLRERITALGLLTSSVVLIVGVMGGIYMGYFPPSAAGAMGAFGVFVIYLWRVRGNVRGTLAAALIDTAGVSCIIFAILIGGLVFSRMLVALGMIDQFVSLITAVAGGPIQFLLLVAVLYMILGMFLDSTSMMVVTLPFIYPVVQHLNIDPIWFGIIIVKLIEMDVMTPPVGMNLFAVMSAVNDPKTTFRHVVVGVVPFLIMEAFVLGLLIAFPELSLWLPRQMLER